MDVSNIGRRETFMPRRIYILNLLYKPDRRERMAAHLAELGTFRADSIRWVHGVEGI